MPTWGWFIVALVLIDAGVLAAWFYARKRPHKKVTATTEPKFVGLDHAARGEIYRLIGDKKQINAIKLLRERTGAGLKEAKAIVESVERGNSLPTPTHFAEMNGIDTNAWDDIIPMLRSLKSEGRTIAAIRLLQAHSGLTLHDAKDAVDRL